MQDPHPPRTDFLGELKRRRVARVGFAYVGGAFVLLQGVQLVLDALGISDEVFRAVVVATLLGFPVALLLGWLFDVTPEGIRFTARRGSASPVVLRVSPRGVLATLAVLAVGGTAFTVSVNLAEPVSAEVRPGADLIAVLPFTSSGEGLADMEQGLVDLLSRNLDQVGAIRTVDPRTVLYRWEQRAGGGDLSFEDALAVAREASAGSVLTGSIVSVQGEVRISADLYSIDGSRMAGARVDGPASEILSLVDSLSLALLREIWRSEEALPNLKVSAITSGNLEAIRAFMAGERHYRASAWDSARVAFSRALAADSVFPLAHMRLAETAGWLEMDELALTHAQLALRWVDHLPAREQILIRAEEHRRAGRRPESIDTLSKYVERYPDDPEGWYLLADDLFHLRGELIRPVSSASEDPLWLFDRALELDPTFVPALLHPLEIAFRTRDEPLIDRYLEMLSRSAVDSAGAALYRAAREALREPRDPDAVAKVIAEASLAGEGALDLSAAVYQPLMRELASWPAADRDRARERLRKTLGTAGATRADLVLLASTGEWDQALARLRDPAVRTAVGRAGVREMVLVPVLAGLAPADALGRVPGMVPRPLEEAAVVMVGAIDRSDAAALRASIARVRSLTGQDVLAQEALVRAGQGFLRVLQGDTVPGLREVESALEHPEFDRDVIEALWFRWTEGMASHPGTRPRVLEALARPWPGSAAFEGVRHFVLGRALEAEGRSADARAAYGRFVDSLGGADAGLPVQEKVRAARAALQRLPA